MYLHSKLLALLALHLKRMSSISSMFGKELITLLTSSICQQGRSSTSFVLKWNGTASSFSTVDWGYLLQDNARVMRLEGGFIWFLKQYPLTARYSWNQMLVRHKKAGGSSKPQNAPMMGLEMVCTGFVMPVYGRTFFEERLHGLGGGGGGFGRASRHDALSSTLACKALTNRGGEICKHNAYMLGSEMM